MKKIIRLTESDLARIVKRTISEMRFSDDEEFDSENELIPYDLCRNMEYLVHADFPSGMITKEKIIQILDDYMNTASRYLRKKLISSDDYEKISDCYEESMLELENTEYNKLNEMEIFKRVIKEQEELFHKKTNENGVFISVKETMNGIFELYISDDDNGFGEVYSFEGDRGLANGVFVQSKLHVQDGKSGEEVFNYIVEKLQQMN